MDKPTPKTYFLDLFDKLRADAMKGRYDPDLWDEFRGLVDESWDEVEEGII